MSNESILRALKKKLSENINVEVLALESMHLNDLVPYMDMLSQFPKLKSLILCDNRLRQLPLDMSDLKQLQYIDISNNLISDVQLAVQSLKTLPKLKELKISVKKQQQNVIIDNLPNLQIINGITLKKKSQNNKRQSNSNMESIQDLNLFRQWIIKQYLRLRNVDEDSIINEKQQQKFFQSIEQIISSSLETLKKKEGQMTKSLESIYFNKTKLEVYEQMKNQCANILAHYGELGSIIIQFFNGQSLLIEDVLHQAIQLVQLQFQINQNKRSQEKEDNNLNRNQLLQKQIRRLKKKIDELCIQNNQLQNQNKSYLQTMLRFSKGDKSFLSSFHSQKQNLSHFVSNNFISASSQRSAERMSKSPLANTGKQTSNYTSKSGKSLTLKQIKDVIQQIYDSKSKFDKINFQSKMARETMHQYLFTHLNQKYGLKNLTIDAASSIIEAIQKYSHQDNDVAVFGKILRNQIDQEFRNTQSQLKMRIHQLLKLGIRAKYPHKTAVQLQQLYKNKINSGLSDHEVQEIVYYLYNKTDAQRLLNKLEAYYHSNRGKEQSHSRRHKDENHFKNNKKIQFGTFLQTVLDFQLKYHERYLRPILVAFKQKDTDLDGIVNQDQFVQIIEKVCEYANELIPEMLDIVDPYENKIITFSQVAKLVQNYPENGPILNRLFEKEQNPLEDLQ